MENVHSSQAGALKRVRPPDRHGSGPLNGWRSGGLTPWSEAVTMLSQAGLMYATKDRSPADTLEQARLAMFRKLPLDVVELVVRWALSGQLTGHEWHICHGCGQPRMVAVRKDQRCHSTPRCNFVMVRIAPRPVLTKKLREALVNDWR